MRIYATTENVYNAVDAVIKHGFAVISGTKTPVESYAVRIKKCLKPYKEIDPNLSLHKDIPHHGYLYYVFDMNRFSHKDLENAVREIGLKNSN
ncbi:hypothetical protein [Acinetobacter dispersus]|uniref:hypothetical protein n=1 Tax=Acinetobacter dispersus TaxID=70348 RepID=UPI00132E941E|nr:hypothetical protein [Acinetobacter dispersus]QHH99221.1 hypothetical protein FPL17_17405 [Acinetobacter dispersus]